MSKVIPSHFRPTLIIFVGETGISSTGTGQTQAGTNQAQSTAGNAAVPASLSIYEYFRDLSYALDQHLLPGIMMLAIEEGSSDALQLEFTAPASASPVPAEDLIRTAVMAVQQHRLKYALEAAGYQVPNPCPQVYLVGKTSSFWISQVATWTNQALGRDRSTSFLSYLLIDDPAYSSTPATTPGWRPPGWTQDLQAQSGNPPLVDYCFLYEQQGQDHTYQQSVDMRYAVAEALFALIAANLTGTPTFSEQAAMPITPEPAEERIGSLATSMIRFPRAAVESYCADMHGVEVIRCQMRQLQKMRSGQQSKQWREQIRERAREDANTILDNLWDNENAAHPVQGHYWANLDFMENEDQKVRLHAAMESIFQAFTYKGAWAQNISRQIQQAERAYSSWQGVMRQAWDTARQEIQNRLIQTLNQLLLDDDTGFLARIYLEQMDSMLDRIYDRFMDLRVTHYERHATEMDELRTKANNPLWAIPANVSPTTLPPGGTGTTQAFPTMSGSSGQGGTNSGASAPAGAPPQPASPNRSGIPRALAANLHARVRWMQNNIPTITNLVGAGLLVVPPMILLLLAPLPASLVKSPLAVLAFSVAIAGIFALLSWLYRRRAQRRVLDAQEDFLNLYRYHFAYQCEQWEDKVRVIIMGPLVKQVRQARTRMENMQEFTERLATLLQTMAEEAERQLFESPGAYRDVLVGDAQMLGKHGASLAVLQERVQQKRIDKPIKEWHQSYERINKQMHAEFSPRNISLLVAASEQELLQPVRDFCRTLVLPYLKDELVEIAAALQPGNTQRKDIWLQALKNSKVLYLPETNSPEFLYIGGRDEHRESLPENLVAPDTTMIRTRQEEWMLVTRFWTGGATTHWTLNPLNAGILNGTLPQSPQW